MKHFLNLPQSLFEILKKIENVKEDKNRIVRSQKYEEAAKLRDDEKQLHTKMADIMKKDISLYSSSEIIKNDCDKVIGAIDLNEDANFSRAYEALGKKANYRYRIALLSSRLKNEEITVDEFFKEVDIVFETAIEDTKNECAQKAFKKFFE